MITIKVDTKSVERRLQRNESNILKVKKVSTEQVGNLTRDYIIRYMPKDTKETASTIGKLSKSHTKDISFVQVGITRKPHPSKKWNGQYFNLARWMFTSPRAESHFHTGDISAMRAVVPYMQERFRTKIELDVNKVLK